MVYKEWQLVPLYWDTIREGAVQNIDKHTVTGNTEDSIFSVIYPAPENLWFTKTFIDENIFKEDEVLEDNKKAISIVNNNDWDPYTEAREAQNGLY